jgi:hypothetical protein
MPTPNLNPKITQAGLALFPAPSVPGFHIELTHVALGTSMYAPLGSETALKAEVARFPILSGTNPSPRQVQVGLTITDTDPSGKSANGKGVGEIGFYSGTTLFAIWSQPTEPLFYKSAAFDIPLAYTLDVSILPAGSVTITVDAQQAGLSSFILAHEAKVDPHPQYLTVVEGDAAYAPKSHTTATDPHPQYLTPAEGDVAYTPLSHASATDPHPQYLTPAEGAAAYAPLSHTSATDPHPQYLTPAEGDAAYIKQGGGPGQSGNKLNMGWTGTGVKVSVDNVDLGSIAFQSWVNQLFTDLVGAAPQTLNQINELAAAIGSDPNFAVTMSNALAGKEAKFASGTRLVFSQGAAPTGWTQVTDDSANNRMLRVVNGAGGGTGGYHDPSYNNVVAAHTHGFSTGNVSADHAHGIGDPGHVHGGGMMVGNLNYGAGGNSYLEEGAGAPNYTREWMTGAATGIWLGGATSNHTHSGSTDNGSSSTNWEPRYINLIICYKN